MDLDLSFLDDLAGEIEAAAVQALKKAGKKVQGDAKMLAPHSVDGGGRLRTDINTKYRRDEQTGEHVVTVGTNVDYAAYVEFGTGSPGKATAIPPKDFDLKFTDKESWAYEDEKGNWHTTKGQPARPFLYPALKQNEAWVREHIDNAVRRALKNA